MSLLIQPGLALPVRTSQECTGLSIPSGWKQPDFSVFSVKEQHDALIPRVRAKITDFMIRGRMFPSHSHAV